MHPSVIEWTRSQVGPGMAAGLDVLEVGAYDVNGSVRPLMGAAASYVGLDIVPGPGVDVVYDGLTIPAVDASYDLVVSTEMLEHAARPWRVVAEMARVLRPGGRVLITARGWVITRQWVESNGVEVGEVATFGYHNPPDLWRYSGSALAELCADAGLTVQDITQDSQVPGWFVAAVKAAS